MNGYDFDKTIFKGNSVQRFSMYCFVRLPYLWLLLPVYFFASVLYGMRILKKDGYLRVLEWFIVFVPNKQKKVIRFWDKNLKHVKQWYLDTKRDDDLIISASPAYLIEEVCSRLGVKCIASPVTKRGTVCGKHCYGEQKAVLYRNQFGEAPLRTFYSDSMSDKPMFRLAEEGYLVKGNKISLVYQNGVEIKGK
ncbi:MAG: haloacid dehalogenase-like hydrolase [Corallococcus sp.]|nr:haloacid dehalogenase-like hydrolase [Corallococcus sp.]MCM1358915.1 haloacid dehalogenase-like hydrolase [Corallococcus sp.]MCM1394903.1 haloacid dehalogenase-like hydrolase [Corallococcus sp.]